MRRDGETFSINALDDAVEFARWQHRTIGRVARYDVPDIISLS